MIHESFVDYLKFIKDLFGWGKTGRIENEREKMERQKKSIFV